MSIMLFENINTEWFNTEALRLPSYKVGRVNFGNGRSYIRLNQDGELCENPMRLYTSLTTAISTCAPMEDGLLDWFIKHGRQQADRLTVLSQHYGTLMHLEIGKFLINGNYNFDGVDQAIEDYLSENNFYDRDCDEWNTKLRYDMLAFVQFYFDYNIKPLGIEYVLLSEKGFGTLIDLVCKMTVKVDGLDYENPYKSGPRKGQPRETKVDKEIFAIINFKSGRKGFYKTNGIQAIAEKMLWEENFPDMPLEGAYNWAPKDWRTEPGYNLKDWTGAVSEEEVNAVLKLAELRYANKAENKTYINISGEISIVDKTVEGVMTKETIDEFASRKYGRTPVEGRVAKPMSKVNKIVKPDAAYEPAPLPI